MIKICKIKGCAEEVCKNSTLCFDHLMEHEREKKLASNEKAIAKQKEKSLEPKKPKKRKKRSELDKTADKAWTAFAKYLKRTQATFSGYFVCYTCEKTLPITDAQAGHCFHKGNMKYRALDFDTNHIRLQCGGCNCYSTIQGNIFQAKLTREIGVEEVEKMIWRRKNEPPLTIEELNNIIIKYGE